MKMPKGVAEDAKATIVVLKAAGLTIATAESCTGGIVAGALTSVPGSSAVVYGGFVTYDNEAKTQMIGVPARTIRDYGAVSWPVARAMADGARKRGNVDIAVSITGIAGSDGGSEKKPIGLVYFGCATHEGTRVVEKRFGDLGRDAIREASVRAALELVREVIAQGVHGPRPGPAAEAGAARTIAPARRG